MKLFKTIFFTDNSEIYDTRIIEAVDYNQAENISDAIADEIIESGVRIWAISTEKVSD